MTPSPDPTVRVVDLRAAGLCLGGARGWWRRHGLSWRAFLRDGIAASALRATGDPIVERAIAQARIREGAS